MTAEHNMAALGSLHAPLLEVAGLGITGVHVLIGVFVVALLMAVSWMRLPKPYTLVLPRDVRERAAAIAYPRYDLPRVCLVTGGNGFLGKNIVNLLREQGVTAVVFDIAAGNWPADSGVISVKGDLTKEADLHDALTKHRVDLVFHVASPDPNSPNVALFQAVNVDGTRTLTKVCREVGIRALVFTSSASVVWEGSAHAGIDESAPYPAAFRDAYAKSKAEAERIVMEAGAAAADKFITISLRPHAIFGPGDRALVPTAVEVCKAGRQRTVVGDGNNIVDWTYVGNVVHAHMLAAQVAWRAIRDGSRCGASGRTYFITNGEPMPFWEFMNWIFLGMGFPTSTMRMPYALILGIANVAQAVVSLLNTCRSKPIALTLSPSRIQIAGTPHWYRIDAARRDLDYRPLWPMQEAVYLTLKAFAHLRNTKPRPDVLRKARAGNLTTVGLMLDWEAAKTSHLDDEACLAGAPPFVKPDDANMPSWTREEVAAHNQPNDAWVVVDGRVYNVSSYLKVHQPGPAPILARAGTDISAPFRGPQHPEHAPAVLARFLIGKLRE